MAILSENMVFSKTRTQDLKNVKQLNCWGSELVDVSIVRHMPFVQVLSLSVNSIKSLADFAYCKNLQELYLRDNKVSDLSQLIHLQELPNLKKLWLAGNPCADIANYRMIVLKILPMLEMLDNIAVTREEVLTAESIQFDVDEETGEIVTQSDFPVRRSTAAAASSAVDQYSKKDYDADEDDEDDDGDDGDATTGDSNLAEFPGCHNKSLRSSSIATPDVPKIHPIINRRTSDADYDSGNLHHHHQQLNSSNSNCQRIKSSNQRFSYETDANRTRGVAPTAHVVAPVHHQHQHHNSNNNHSVVVTPVSMVRSGSINADNIVFSDNSSMTGATGGGGQQQQQQNYTSTTTTITSSQSASACKSNSGSNSNAAAGGGACASTSSSSSTSTAGARMLLPKGGRNRNANILSAILCLIKELDVASLEVVDTEIHCRMEELGNA